MSSAARLQELFLRWKHARDEGVSLSLEDLCRDCPELIEPFRRYLENPAAPEPNPVAQLAPGAEPLPGYRLVEFLGRGGFGEVWKVIGPGGFPVALKFVSLASSALVSEVRSLDLMKHIRHANLLSYTGAWEAHGMLIIGMELAEGTLQQRLERCQASGQSGIPFAELIEYTREAAKGLDFLHQCRPGGSGAGIQHRDVKPQNLMLVGGSVRVGDFGLAKFMETTLASNSGSLTVSYAAPEFFAGQTARTSDQYSLAVTYCQLRTGRLPFVGTTAAIMAGHLTRPPDLEALPAAERPAVARALAKKPEERWPDCRSFAEALARGGEATPSVPAAPPSETERYAASVRQQSRQSDTSVDGARAADSRTEPASSWRGDTRRPRGVPVPIVLALVLVASGSAIWWAVRSANEETPAPIAKGPPPGADGQAAKPDKRAVPRARFEEALTAASAGDWHRTRRLLGEVLRADPENVDAHLWRAEARLVLKDPAGALADAAEALRLSPGSARGYLLSGRAQLDSGKPQGAVEAFGNAILHGRATAEVYSLRGQAYLGTKAFTKALNDLDRAIAMKPGVADYHRLRAEVRDQLGNAAGARLDRDEAQRLQGPAKTDGKK